MMPCRVDDRVQLLHGPYRAPPLEVGDRATCLRRDCDVKITGWTDAPIPWPVGVPAGRRSASGIVLGEELAARFDASRPRRSSTGGESQHSLSGAGGRR